MSRANIELVLQWGLTSLNGVPNQGEALKLQGRIQLDEEVERLSRVSIKFIQPRIFEDIRQTCKLTYDSYIQSLTEMPMRGGERANTSKSGAKFWTSGCKRFIIKTISQEEIRCINEVFPAYLQHLKAHPSSLLSRILAAYTISIRGHHSHVVVLTNIFFPTDKISVVYDLKGTTEDRLVPESMLEITNVGKDLNFRGQTINLNSAENAERFRQLIEADSAFLRANGIMDYSLLLGVTLVAKQGTSPYHKRISRSASYNSMFLTHDKLNGSLRDSSAEFVQSWPAADESIMYRMAVIDILQRWTPRKVAAYVFKSATLRLVYSIDTMPPRAYSVRFIKHMHGLVEPAQQVDGVMSGRSNTAAADPDEPSVVPPKTLQPPEPKRRQAEEASSESQGKITSPTVESDGAV